MSSLQLDRPDSYSIAASLLPGVPADLILEIYGRAPGNEIASGKFASPESSAALAANTFGPFVARPAEVQPPPGGEAWGWPASSVRLEAILRFPWRGGRHPCLDALIETPSALIGVESKRYEPFRAKAAVAWSDAYPRPVWGAAMAGYERIRDRLQEGRSTFALLDAAQLVKHAFALRTTVHREERCRGKLPVLLYLYAEPQQWPSGRPISRAAIEAHRAEIRSFADAVSGDEVVFHACSYRELISAWTASSHDFNRGHAAAIASRFDL
jgi:hypothetical protein